MQYETFDLQFEGCGHTVKIPALHNTDDSECYICHPELRERPAKGKCPKCSAEEPIFPAISLGDAVVTTMDKSTKVKILRAAKDELMRHSLDTFVNHPPSVAQGGSGVMVTGCPACRKRFQTINQLMYQLADDVLPKILRLAFHIAEAR